MKQIPVLTLVISLFLLLPLLHISGQEDQKPRVIILSDINNAGGDPDDKQSMGHLLMYANEIDIKAIVPDYWNGKGIEATREALDVYEKDFFNPDYAFQHSGYPEPDYLRSLVAINNADAVARIIAEARKADLRPLYILVWGGMNTLYNTLMEAPDIVSKLRVLTIATNVMADNPDSRQNAEVDTYCKKSNWNGRKRNEIFEDPRFKELWWIENDWAYNGMFEGQEPRDFLQEIKQHGALGYYIWEVVQPKSWAHYFRAGDTPTLLYLLEDFNHDDPQQFTWGGKFIQPFPEERPNYWTDDAGNDSWDYNDPCNSWDLAQEVYVYRVNTLLRHRREMYKAYRQKMNSVYRSKQ